MSTEQTPVDATDDLDAFSAEFFGQNKAPQEETTSEEKDQDEEPLDTDAIEKEDTQPEDDTLEDEDDETPDEEPEAKPEPKKKNRFQERIDELTNARREAERKAAALEERLAKLEQNEKPTPTPKVEENTGPTPEDTNEDGTEKYPLGEFDPQYIRDLTRHTLEVERKALQAKDAEVEQQKELEAQKAALQTEWNEKLVPAKERYPDFAEKGAELYETFASIDEQYGEYLTSTIMSMDHGPDVLYYLSNNLDEAAKIVNAGAAKATLALGRLEARFVVAEEEKQKARPKVSKAPTPPPHVNKGSSAAQAEVPDDTDDLDAFAAKLFDKRRRR